MTKQEAIEYLKKHLQPGDTVYYCIRHVSTSGMMRHISLHVVKDGKIQGIGYPAQVALGYPAAEGWSWRGAKVKGCGMDMGFHFVSSLAAELFGDYQLLCAEQL